MAVFVRVRYLLMSVFICGTLLLLQDAAAFYLPRLAPVSFCEKSTTDDPQRKCQDKIELFVNRLNSAKSVSPFDYSAFDFCAITSEKRTSENLGQVLFGERIEPSPYKFTFNQREACRPVCTKTYNPSNKDDQASLDFLKKGMLLNYQHHWIVDNMPVTWCYDVEDNQKFCDPGFPIGCYVTEMGLAKDACVANADFNDKDMFYIFNHVDIVIFYHKVENEVGAARLVAAKLEPKSFKHADPSAPDCKGPPMSIKNKFTEAINITYTYSVQFQEEPNINWASRLDYIPESMPHTNIQWFRLLLRRFLKMTPHRTPLDSLSIEERWVG